MIPIAPQIGFDRFIQLDWVAAALKVSTGVASLDELNELLDAAGLGNEAKIKTRTKLNALVLEPRSDLVDFINRGMPLGLEGTLKPDEVYSLVAYLLFLNKVIPEDQVLNKDNLAKVKMPIGEEYGKPHEFKVNAPRLPGYPY